MKSKKIVSLFLALCMVFSMGITAFAATKTTTVSYAGQGTSQYTVTVPSKLAPGESGTVTVEGTWPIYECLSVTAPSKINLVSAMAGSATLDITFAGIEQQGNMYDPISVSETITVGELTKVPLFDTLTGTITYTISLDEIT